MPMDNVATGVRLGTRSLALEILSSLPPGGRRCEDNGRQVWQRGASIVDLAKDFSISTETVRVVLRELATQYPVRTGNVAPVMLPNGGRVRGGHCAFIEAVDETDPRFEHVRTVCEAYQAEYDNG